MKTLLSTDCLYRVFVSWDHTAILKTTSNTLFSLFMLFPHREDLT